MNKQLAQILVDTGYTHMALNLRANNPKATDDELDRMIDELYECECELLRLIKHEKREKRQTS